MLVVSYNKCDISIKFFSDYNINQILEMLAWYITPQNALLILKYIASKGILVSRDPSKMIVVCCESQLKAA